MTDLSLTDRNAVDAIVGAVMSSVNLPGCLISITGPAGDYKKAYRNTTIANSTPVLTTDHHVRIASLTKTFTGTAFWMAVDDGLVSLNDVLEDFYPGVPNGNIITMAHLLSMRAGVYNYTSDFGVLMKILLSPASDFSEEEALAIIKAGKSQYTPGTSYAYNNSNAILIGKVVEVVRGRELRDVIQDDILTPLGMTESSWPSDVSIPEPSASKKKYNPEFAGAAGALVSTIGDMTKWAEAMRDGTLISSASKAAWHNTFLSTVNSPGTHPPDNFSYGYFMFSFGSWRGHDGGITGFGSACGFDTTSGATISVSENAGYNVSWFRILRDIAAYLYPDSVGNSARAGLFIAATTSAAVGGSAHASATRTVQAVTTAALTHVVGAAGQASLQVNAGVTASATLHGVAGAGLAVTAATSVSLGAELFADAALEVVANARARGLLPLLYIPRNKVVVPFEDRRVLVHR